MLVQGLLGPGRKPGKGVVVGLVEAEIIRQLPAHDELLQKGLPGSVMAAAALHLQGHPLRPDLPEMEVGGEVRLAVRVGSLRRSP